MSASETKLPIPVFNLTGYISESGVSQSSWFNVDLSPQTPVTHFDVVTSLQRAAETEEIPAIVVEVDQAAFTFAQLQEIKREMEAVKDAGKEVWFYSDVLTFQTAVLGSAASHFVLNPEAVIALSGFHSENLYYKGLLDKVGITIDVVHIGDFKSAGENFYRTKPSEASLKQSNILFDSLYNTLVTEIAIGRALTRDSVSAFIDRGRATAREARKNGLVDRLQSRTDLVSELRNKYGVEASFERDYVQQGTATTEVDGFFDLMKLMFSSGKDKTPQEDYIAVVVFEGGINMASIAPARNEVLRLVDDVQCQGLVLRVNSPGGSALASDILWEALDEFRQSERPFVVSMGGVAASGGYYISSGADVVFAEPTTITGSIGVVGMKVAVGDALAELGVSSHEFKRGAHADLYNSSRPFSPEERKIVRNSMLDVYRTFKRRITAGRGDRLQGDLEAMAGGRVYTGRDALRLGLVDELGGLNQAIAKAAELAEMETLNTALFPKPTSALDSFFQPKGENNDDFLSLKSRSQSFNLAEILAPELSVLSLLPDDKKRQIEEGLQILQSLEGENIQLIAPPVPR